MPFSSTIPDTSSAAQSSSLSFGFANPQFQISQFSVSERRLGALWGAFPTVPGYLDAVRVEPRNDTLVQVRISQGKCTE